MKRILQLVLILALILSPQIGLAQERLSTEVPTLTQYEQNHAQTLYQGAKRATFGSAALTATGAIVWYGFERYAKKHATSDVVETNPLWLISILQTIMAGSCLVASLPFYLWSWDLVHHPNGVGLALGNENKSWGGRVDLGLGGESPVVAIGGSVGYNFSRRLYVGLGAGYEKLLHNYGGDYNYAAIPVYADIQWRFGESRITPYIGVKAGFDVNIVPVPYGSLDWGVSYRCQKSKGAWWYALSLSNNEKNQVSFRISRSF
ncbi:MAG: hypothetical protein II358_04365 [Tidjanibacter sp.]|nr:hypothetical protein [Tidjanibacter sp.]